MQESYASIKKEVKKFNDTVWIFNKRLLIPSFKHRIKNLFFYFRKILETFAKRHKSKHDLSKNQYYENNI